METKMSSHVLPLSPFSNDHHSLAVSTPRDILDRPTDGLELILEDMLLVHSVPDTNLARNI